MTMKKNIFGFLLIGMGVMGLASCSDEIDNPYASTSTVNIISSSLNFDAAASQGSIRYTAEGTVTVTTANPWCHATVSGDSVIVTVDQNVNKSGRASSVTIHDNNGSTTLAVLQNGVVAELEVNTVSRSDDEAATVKYAFKGNLDFSVLSAPDWVTASFVGDSFQVTFTENTTGHLRKGYIHYGCGDFKDSIRVIQADFDADIAGKWDVTYYKSATSEATTTLHNTVLSAEGLKINSNLTLPMTYDPDECTLTVSTGSYVGSFVYPDYSYYIYAIFGLRNDWFAYSTGYYLVGTLDYSEATGTTLNFDYMVSGFEVNSIIFGIFTAQSLDKDHDTGYTYDQWIHPVLKRVENSSAKEHSDK